VKEITAYLFITTALATTEQIGIAVMLCICIREVLGSNFSRDIGYHD
jgi:hypothetical protein